MRQLKISKSITHRENLSIDKYLTEIAKQELITAEEEILLARRIKSGDIAALNKLTLANLRFVVSVAKQYQNKGLSLSDLINEGNMGLIKAARRFDETRGFKFISYAVWWIRQGIIQAISEQSRVVRLPLNKLAVLNKIKKVNDLLEQSLERSPTHGEIADELQMSENEIMVTMQASAWHVSADAVLNESEGFTIMDKIPDASTPKPDQEILDLSLRIEISRAMSGLSQRESDVIMLLYGIGGGEEHSLEEIGQRFGLTRERVRQIKEKALSKLRKEGRCVLLREYL